MRDLDIDSLRERANTGDPQSLATLGQRLLTGAGVASSPAEGIALIRTAAERDDAQAHVLLSVLSAWGILQPRNVPSALDHLARAAELGSVIAQRELQLLARSTASDWRALRRQIDLVAWTTPPPAKVVVEQPRIVVIDRFATPEECAWLIERGRPGLRRAQVYHGSSKLQTADLRTNSEADFTFQHADVVLNLIRERMAAVARAPVSHFEVTKLLHYERGEQFGLHADFLELNTPELVREVETRGQRAATFLTYLNDGYEGGETDFSRADFQFKGALGQALLFLNIDAKGAPDYNTLHSGMPLVRGEKWILSQWIRTKTVSG